jgi:Delta3,5-Delta2,4-dienoyl-CoA isomerase
MSESTLLKLEQQEHIAWVTLNRPEKRNALNFQMLEQLVASLHQLDQDDNIRVIVIKGEGKSFCAGLELTALAGLIEKKSADYRERLRRTILHGQTSTNVIEMCNKPVILAVHSHCIGGGVDIACACDIRIATKDAIFSVRETKLAFVADLGTTQRLQRIVGEPWARELCLTGRDFSGEEAFQMGFITHLCEDQDDLIQKAEALAREIADNSPLAVQGVKDVLRFTSDHGTAAGLKYVAQKNAAMLICDDGIEAVTAAMEKRKPVFKGK